MITTIAFQLCSFPAFALIYDNLRNRIHGLNMFRLKKVEKDVGFWFSMIQNIKKNTREN